MYSLLTSRIMPRTTIDLDGSVLAELRRQAAAAGKSMGATASELLARALAELEGESTAPSPTLPTKAMGEPLVDLEDAEAVRAALYQSP